MEYPKNIHRSCQYYGEKSYSDYAGVFSIIKVTRKKKFPSNDSDIVNTITDWYDQNKKQKPYQNMSLISQKCTTFNKQVYCYPFACYM